MKPNPNTIPKGITQPLKRASFCLVLAIFLAVCWGSFAPLVTTIKANGSLISAKPSYNIQHAYDGKIKAVHIKLQSKVKKGQVLFKLDVKKANSSLAEIQHQISNIEIENSVIENILDDDIQQQQEKISREFNRIAGHYEEKRKQLSFDISAAQKLSKTSFKQAKSLQTGIEILLQRRAAFYQRSEDLTSLVQKGIASKTQEQIQFDEILTIDGQVNSKKGQLISLNNQNQQAKLSIKQLKSKFRLSLFSQLQNNKARLSDLKRQSTTLEDEVSSSVIISPISGTVIFLGYDTNGMYVERGETLVTLSQILSEPKVQLIIPTQAIDQVSIGMVGKLTIPNLPQRNLPPIQVKLI